MEEVKSRICCEYEEYIKLSDELKSHQDEQIKLQKKIDKTNEAVSSLKATRDKYNEFIQMQEQYDTINAELSDIVKEHESIVEQVKQHQIKMHDKEARICELKVELKNIEAAKRENDECERKRKLSLVVVYIINNVFVDNLLTKKIIPNFCDSVNSILTSFVDYKISMKYENKKLSVFKLDRDGLLSNASKLSGYETLMANIAFRLAINNINKLYKTNFFIIDEAFAFCDEQSICKISNLFGYMRKIFDFVIVVSHNEQIKSYADGDLPIQTRNGSSYINMISEANAPKFIKYKELMERDFILGRAKKDHSLMKRKT